ncbi:MAG: hypothetical protein HND52_11375 [Ignavibacteriae bacterium]|nr:hypothetical protein [Ignavibacteriota bacterium]NOG98549.1 hypothetical protein [Ignavibacteriota bacterium]
MNTAFIGESGGNPLADLISDDIYNLLNAKGLINETSVRDHLIRAKFKELRSTKMSAGDAIDAIRKEHPYLQFDTIRKIVYAVKR